MSVYKYRSGKEYLKRDLDSLINDSFWASDAISLNDPCETIIDSETIKNQIVTAIGLLHKKNPGIRISPNGVFEALNQLLKLPIGIFSLSKSYNDELLWAYYANSHKGFCIEYELKTLQNPYLMNEYFYCPVTYADSPPIITVNDLLNFDELNELNSDLSKNSLLAKFTSTKSKRWEHEQEIRIITDSSGKQACDFRAVKSIYFGLKMAEEEKIEIMKALKGRGIKYFQMYLESKSYKFNAKEVADKYLNCTPYLYKISSVTENSVREGEVKQEYKNFIPYLYKAVEVARREPYCQHVESVAFSTSRSTTNAPVIFVTCITTNDNYINLFYEITEIDKQYALITDL